MLTNILIRLFDNRFVSALFCHFLTVINTFSYTFYEKYFLLFVIPPFHLSMVIIVIIKRLRVVELWWNYGWNFT